MYMEEPAVASLSAIKLDGTDEVGDGDNKTKVQEIFGKYLGKKSDALGIATTDGTTTGQYGLVGSSTSWYVVYRLTASDTTGVRAKLKAKAEASDIYGVATVTTTDNCGFASYYTNPENAGSDFYIALKVR